VYAGGVDRKLIGKSADARPSEEPTDETLFLRMQTADMEALGVLFSRYARLTLGIARRILRDEHEAEDLVQDVFLFLFFKSKLFNPSKGSARSWLMQVAYHRAFDRRRYLSARSFCVREGVNGGAAKALVSAINPGVENTEEFFAWQSYLRPALDQLSEDQRKTISLYFYEGYTLREISQKLNRSFGNVQHDFYRGLDRLRKYAFDKNGDT
jgi:RNA polymerase sigma-70 factor (ECF subfamily)